MDAKSKPLSDVVAAPVEKLSTKTMLLYGSGQTGAQLFRDAPAVLLPLFMTTMLGVTPWLAGVVVLVPKLWVIACDPIIGALSDHYKPRFGRRPFLAWGALFTALTFMGLFSFAVFPSPGIAALTVGALFFLFSTAFSAFSVPYLAVASELSHDPHERTKVLAFRMIFSIVGVIMGVGLAQPLVFSLGGDAAAWRSMAIIFGSICLLAMLATTYGVPRDFGPAKVAAPNMGLRRFTALLENKPFVILNLTMLVQTIAQGSSFAVVGFIFIYAVGDIGMLLPFVLSMALGAMASQPFWVKFSGRVGKEHAFLVACIGWMLITITWIWVGPADDVLVTLPLWGELPTQHFLVLLRGVIIGVTNSGFSVLTFSLFTDTIGYQREHHGDVDEGVFSGVFSATEKLAVALGPLLAGVVLSIYGFKSSTGGPVAQDETAIWGMILCYSIIPAVILGLSLLVFSRYGKAARLSPVVQ
ncbi:MAG: GPH family glycoside/pentoside/hexuronide:cation symporter [Halieaceae bacterium]|jgi:GPH family glycoside/pentoside/hexuronide:cation symporter